MLPRDFGPYRLLERIAVGGMAEIYLAKTRGLAGFEKYLALKLLHESYAEDQRFVSMLIEEAKIAVRLSHVNIAQIFDLGVQDNRYFIAMEYVEGLDLFQIMRAVSDRELPVPFDVAIYLVREVLLALDYAHRQKDDSGRPLNIIHRDISPQNVLISDVGEVKLVDFGIAKAATRSQETRVGVIKGKYYYMSPEQALGRPMDQRSDLFSAGIILYEVLSGQMLYLEEDVPKLLEMVRKAEITPPSRLRPNIPAALEAIVIKALRRRPEERYQTAREFHSELTALLAEIAPGFTAERAAQLVRLARGQSPAPPIPAEPPRLPPPPSPPPATLDRPAQKNRDPALQTSQIPMERLMSRADFAPPREQSVIYKFDQVATGNGTAENTVVATVLPVSAPNTTADARISPLVTDGQRWEDDGPTSRREPELLASQPFAHATREIDPAMVLDPQTSPSPTPLQNNTTPPGPTVPPRSAGSVPTPTPIALNWPPLPPPMPPPTPRPGPAPAATPTAPPVLAPSEASAWQAPTLPAEPAWTAALPQARSSVGAPLLRPPPRPRRLAAWIAAGTLLFLAALSVLLLAWWPFGSAKAEIEVISVPAGASVWLDGRKLSQTTQLTIQVPSASRDYRLEVKMPSFEPWQTTIRFGEQRQVRALAVLTPKYGKIEIASTPDQADVYINSEHHGRTPLVVSGLSLAESPQVELRKRGYRPQTHALEWKGRAFLSLRVTLEASR